MLTFTFIDFVRRFFDGSKWLLITLDILVVLIYAVYFGGIKKWRIKLRHGFSMILLILVLFILFLWTILEMFNIAYPSMIVSLAGVRAYWLAVPMISIGYYLAGHLNARDYERMYKYLLLLSIAVIAFSVIQALVDRGQLVGILSKLLTPMGHGIHSYGQEAHELSSSFFASSKRYGKYLLFCYLVLWAINKARNRSGIFIFILFFIGMYAGGSREALWVFLFFHILYYTLISANRMRNFAAATLLVVIILFSVNMVPNSVHSSFHDSQRITFLFAFGESVAERIQIMMPFTNLNLNNSHLLYGIGPGKYGAEALLVPEIAKQTYGADERFFYPHEFFRSSMSFADAGMAKIIIELGVVGFIIYSVFIVILIFMALQGLFLCRSDSFSIAASYWILSWILFFFKAHVTISDLMLSVFLFCSVGYVIGIKQTMKQKKYPVVLWHRGE